MMIVLIESTSPRFDGKNLNNISLCKILCLENTENDV